MTGAGRPLRFLLLVIGGWTGARLWFLWPAVPTLPALVRAVAPLAQGADGKAIIADVRTLPVVPASPRSADEADRAPGESRAPLAARTPMRQDTAAERSMAVEGPSLLRFGDPVPGPAAPLADAELPAPTAPGSARTPSRLSGSAWLLARGGPALAGGLAGAQLGGSQAGLRLAYAVDRARRLAIVGRVSTAIGGSGASRFLSDREGAVGLAWRPTRLPVTLVAEQRFVWERGGHGGPVLGLLAGLPPTPIAAGFRLEAYGQAGGIARSGAGNGVEAFGDGAARLTRPVPLGRLRLDVGAGSWGGAQRGAARLDVGPTIGAALPIAGHALRLAADWRQRIAGDAAPGSGPALSLGMDF